MYVCMYVPSYTRSRPLVQGEERIELTIIAILLLLLLLLIIIIIIISVIKKCLL